MSKLIKAAGIGLVLAGIVTSPAMAQDRYPSNTVRVVVGYPPGAIADLSARMLAQRLATQMSASFIVDNKPGAGTQIANDFVAKSRPDGYTMLYNDASITMGRALGVEMNYDLFRDLAPVSRTLFTPLLLFVELNLPVSTLADFIAHVRANPDKLSYGSSGIGAPNHLGPLLFLQTHNIKSVHVPYSKGGTAAYMIDIVAGRLPWAVAGVTAVMPLAKDRKIKVLAIGSQQRSPLLPDVPTFTETMPGFQMGSWYGAMVAAKTPTAIIQRLNGEIVKAMQDAELRAKLAQEGAEPVTSTPEGYGAYLKTELDRWTTVVKTAGVKLE